jgi:hypothetical protein
MLLEENVIDVPWDFTDSMQMDVCVSLLQITTNQVLQFKRLISSKNNKDINTYFNYSKFLQLQPVIAIVLEPLTMIVMYKLVNANVTKTRMVVDVTNANQATGIFLTVNHVRFLNFG